MPSRDGQNTDAVDQIEIRSPCSVPWSEMRGDERVRHCGQCKQNVYNVAAMSRGEARRLVAAKEGRLCVRILRRPDGTVVTGDCWARLSAARRRGVIPWLVTLAVVGWAELAAMRFGLASLHRLFGVPAQGLVRVGERVGAPPPPAPPVSAPGRPAVLPVERPHEIKGEVARVELLGKRSPPR
jgi:hypothetical protein